MIEDRSDTSGRIDCSTEAFVRLPHIFDAVLLSWPDHPTRSIAIRPAELEKRLQVVRLNRRLRHKGLA